MVTAQAFLLTYNPAYWFWPLNERTTPRLGSWNVGRRTGGVSPDDDVYVLQQGASGRGLLARGVATSPVFEEPHWDGIAGHRTHSIEVQWLEIATSPVIETAELRYAVPGVHWAPRQSGALVPAAATLRLKEVWLDAWTSHLPTSNG